MQIKVDTIKMEVFIVSTFSYTEIMERIQNASALNNKFRTKHFCLLLPDNLQIFIKELTI